MHKSKIAIAAAVCGGLAGGALVGAPMISLAVTDDTTTTTTDDTGTTATTDGTGTTSGDDENCPGGRRRGPGHRPGGLFLEPGAIAELLGIERDELGERIRDGETIAEIARDEGIEPQTVIDTLVDEAQTNLDERYETASSDLEERVTDLVNGELLDRDGED